MKSDSWGESTDEEQGVQVRPLLSYPSRETDNDLRDGRHLSGRREVGIPDHVTYT